MPGPPCPRCSHRLPSGELLIAATARYCARVTCACGTVVEETWQSRLASVGATTLGLVALVIATERLALWAQVPLAVVAWFGAHLALLPLRRWRAVRPG